MSPCWLDGMRSMPARYSVMSFASADILRGGAGEIAVLAQHETVVLDHRAAARRRHQDGVEAALFRFPLPHRDVGAGARQRVAVTAEVMGQRAAALLVLDQHDLDAVARQQIDGGLVDARRQHLLGAALQQRDPPAPRRRRPETRCRRLVPAPAGCSGASASIALIRRSRVGRRRAGFGVGSRAANGRPSRARIMLARNSPGRGSTQRQHRAQQRARPAAANSPARS